MDIVIACAIGLLLDFALGERLSSICPAVLFGKLIAKLEPLMRAKFPATAQGEFRGGVVLVIVVCATAFLVPFVILLVCNLFLPPLGVVLSGFWFYQIVATKGLADAGKKVYTALTSGNIEDARYAVSMIVGRDTQNLSEVGVTRATVETVAENASDGCVAPLFWFVVGGAPLAMLYKAINTMDSMIAYKNEKYMHFGTCAAKLDDVANWIPARLCAFALMAAAALQDCDMKRTWRVYRRDKRRSPSPNSAQCESVVAGALGVTLLGPMYYGGVLHDKEFIGEETRCIEAADILATNSLLYKAVVVSAVVFCLIRVAILAAMGVLL